MEREKNLWLVINVDIQQIACFYGAYLWGYFDPSPKILKYWGRFIQHNPVPYRGNHLLGSSLDRCILLTMRCGVFPVSRDISSRITFAKSELLKSGGLIKDIFNVGTMNVRPILKQSLLASTNYEWLLALVIAEISPEIWKILIF